MINLELPKKILGEWTTTYPKYADRFFAIEKRLITIGTAYLIVAYTNAIFRPLREQHW